MKHEELYMSEDSLHDEEYYRTAMNASLVNSQMVELFFSIFFHFLRVVNKNKFALS